MRMKMVQKLQSVGGLAGMLLFVMIGLVSMVADSGHAGKMPTAPVLIPSVVAPARALGEAFVAVAAYVRPAVVSVYSEKMLKSQSPESMLPFNDEFSQQFFGSHFEFPKHQGQSPLHRIPLRGMGSGMIVDIRGYILTNNHVVQDLDEIKVQMADRQQFDAEIVGADPKTDVAILRLKKKNQVDWPTIQLGDSDAVQVGELVLAVGAPFGFSQTVTTGIISAKGQPDVNLMDDEDLLQTDASINAGNSGGPLTNMRGEVIGMNSVVATRVGTFAGTGFAIPANLIKSMLPSLIKGERIARGMIGLVLQDFNKELAAQFNLPPGKGVLVAQVAKDSPADKAGIQVGDVILRYDGAEIANARQLRSRVAVTVPDAKVKVDLIRNGKEETVSVQIARQAEEPAVAVKKSTADADPLRQLGFGTQLLTPELARQSGVPDEKGVIISTVEDDSPAFMADLRAGDLIQEVDHQKVSVVEELQAILSKAKGKGNLLFLLNRKGENLFVVVQTK